MIPVRSSGHCLLLGQHNSIRWFHSDATITAVANETIALSHNVSVAGTVTAGRIESATINELRQMIEQLNATITRLLHP